MATASKSSAQTAAAPNANRKTPIGKIGLVFLLAGLGVATAGLVALGPARADRASAEAGVRARAQAKADLIAATERLRGRAAAAAALAPLTAALESDVDGATLLDLFQSEDWWQPYRSGNLTARVISERGLLTTVGPLALGTRDRQLVTEARRTGTAAAQLVCGEKPCLVGAARVDLRGHAPAVLVMAEPMDARYAPALRPEPQLPPLMPNGVLVQLVAGGVLTLVGLGLIALRPRTVIAAHAHAAHTPAGPVSMAGAPATGAAVAAAPDADARESAAPEAAVPRSAIGESTMRFGTPQKARDGVSVPASPGASSSPAQVVVGTGAGRPQENPRRVVSVSSPPMVKSATDPKVFGRYRLVDRLGEGGMSEVFTAVAYGVEGFSRTFVLKRLKPELARDKEAVAQFFDEAKLQASLVHSNIVPVFDFGKVGDEYFLTQEYIRGRDIVQLLARNYERTHVTLPENVGYHIVHETLQALSYAHNKRDTTGRPLALVHRDVSPANILVSLLGEVKLFDFGIVKANHRRSQTQVGMVKGNANFMSPEQARGQAVDARSDLFSLGLVLYYCLTNRLLYDGENDLDVLYQAATGPSAKDRLALDALPEPAASILDRALAIDPADRFQDAMEFAAAIDPYARGGKTATADLMHKIFGDELQDEAAA